jgi:pyruvate/2-oxoglutarate dehydrogenase complex dihydrolipoamide dehydrogenase (E3) component
MNNSSTQPESFDLLVLGSGEAGKYLAWTMAGKGARTAVVERKYVGGSCPNIACLPSKNIIHSAKVASLFFRSHEFGISKDNCRIDMSAVRDRKRRMVDGLVKTHLAQFAASGAELIVGSGRFTGPRTLTVSLPGGGERVLRGKNVVISTGSRTSIDSTPGLREVGPLTHVEALELDHLPDHLLVLGGGYIGLELAQAMRRFGSNVTIIERHSRLAHREDPDVSDAFCELFRDEGIRVIADAVVKRVEGKSGQGIKAHIVRGGVEDTIEGTHLLVATGRTPNTENLGLELAGIETTDRGFIKVNDQLKTTAPGVWAVGDCAGSPHFTHIAFDDFRVVWHNIAGGSRVTTGRQVPFCVFTDPEFARVGLSETEAKRLGVDYRLEKLPISAVLRALTLSETRGFLKVLIEPKSDRILGFAALGVNAGEILAPVQVAMLAGLPFTALRDTIFAHPTLAEGLIPLFAKAPSGTAPASVGGRTKRN